MSQLHLAVLGPPQAHHGTQPLSFSTRKELALLVYLAIEPGKHQRKRLIALLWPESDAARGSAAFRSTLLRLRETLEEHNAEEDAHLEVDYTTLALNQRQLSFDLHTLDAACLQAEQLSTHPPASATEKQQATIAELERVSRLVRGPFLQDFMLHEALPFEEWVRAQREYWQARLRSFFDRLANLQEALGAFDQAIESMRRWLSVDPLHEDGCLHLMRLYDQQGNRRAALETYEACRALLESELHALPSPQLSALAERLRRDMPVVRLPQTSGPSTPPSALSLLQTPLIGRDREFARLVEGYIQVRTAQGSARTHVVLVEGEAGIGKTRLVSEFVTWAREQGAEVLAGRAFEMGGRLPYQPLISALRPRLDEENAPDDLLADVWLSALVRILPELRERYPDLPAPTSEEAIVQAQLFEAVARLIEAWARHKPVVLWLDDLHWADAASLDLLVYLIASWRERATAVLLVLSLRSEEEYSPALVEWKANLAHSITPTQLRLSSLSQSETQQLVQMLSGGTSSASSEQAGVWLYRETAGHPFYLLETLKLLLERQLLLPIYVPQQGWMLDFTRLCQQASLHQRMLPTSVRELIRVRMSRLTPQSHALLLAAAVLDHFSTFEHLAVVAGLSEMEVLSGLDELIAQRFLTERQAEREGVTESVYVFTHDKLREVVYQEASEARRRIFHRRAFELLQQAGASAADLAHQGWHAGLAEASFRYLVQAGDEAMLVFAMHDAVTCYERARRILAPVQTSIPASSFVPASDSMYLLLQLGRTYELLQQWEHAQRVYEALHLAAGQSHDQYMGAVALNRLLSERLAVRGDIELHAARLCMISALQGDWSQALLYAQQAQAAREDLYESMSATGLAQQAFGEATRKVRELAEKISDASLRSSFLNSPPVQHLLQRESARPHPVKQS